MLLEALGMGVIVRPLYDPERASTGLSPGCEPLYLGSKNPMSQQGIVISVGPEQPFLCQDDRILYHPFVQNPIEWEGREYLQVPYRHIVGRLSLNGELLPLPHNVVVKPDFSPAGRPTLDEKSKLWLPRQVFDIEVPCTGVVIRRGALVKDLDIGQRVLFPPEVGDEVGLSEVYYNIPEKDILAVLLTDLPVSVMATTQWRGSHA